MEKVALQTKYLFGCLLRNTVPGTTVASSLSEKREIEDIFCIYCNCFSFYTTLLIDALMSAIIESTEFDVRNIQHNKSPCTPSITNEYSSPAAALHHAMHSLLSQLVGRYECISTVYLSTDAQMLKPILALVSYNIIMTRH